MFRHSRTLSDGSLGPPNGKLPFGSKVVVNSSYGTLNMQNSFYH
jgi:hypothetical protein